MFSYKLNEKGSLSQEESAHRITSKSKILDRKKREGILLYCSRLQNLQIYDFLP